MTLPRILLAMGMVMVGFAAHAQAITKPKEFYFDTDANARLIVAVEGQGDALTVDLLKARERGRKVVEVTAQLAHISMTEKRIDLGKKLYEQALQGAQPSSGLGRSIHWNYGWDLFRNGEPESALREWAGLASGFGAYSWVPPTLALALWKTDRKPEALQWYAAAVRTEPNLWIDPANFPKLLPDWREQDRASLAEVQAAWAANPPAWP